MTAFDPQTATENQVLRNKAYWQAHDIADELGKLATRIAHEAAPLRNESRPAASIVADVVNAYTQGSNAIGAIFWSMIRELERMK